jgi:hypothetical protein
LQVPISYSTQLVLCLIGAVASRAHNCIKNHVRLDFCNGDHKDRVAAALAFGAIRPVPDNALGQRAAEDIRDRIEINKKWVTQP